MKKLMRIIFLSDYVTKDLLYTQVFFLGVAVFGWLFFYFVLNPISSIPFALLTIIYIIRLCFMLKVWKQGTKKL